MATAEQQVHDLSLHSVLFQSLTLLERLRGFGDAEYSPEAIRIRDLFVLLIEQVRQRLWNIHQQRPRNTTSQIDRPLGEAETGQIIELGKFIQGIHACLRYLESSKAPATPPEIQTAITTLVHQHVPPSLLCQPDEVVVLVPPQWTYNLKYVNLLSNLEQLTDFAVLDPQGEFSTTDFRSFLSALWQQRGPKNSCLPQHVAVISFAGLDGHDALIYPLLAHELGHLIDFSYEHTIHNNPQLQAQKHVVTIAESREIFDRIYNPNPPSVSLEPYRQDEVNRLRTLANEHIRVCLQEIAADLLATRMLGLPYFLAMAEYFKANFQWPQEPIDSSSGYPGMAYRLQIVYQELCEPAAGFQVVGQLQQLLTTASPASPAHSAIQRGLDYLGQWSDRFSSLAIPPSARLTVQASLAPLVQERVERMLSALRALIREVIPAERLPSMAAHLADLITLLDKRIPPAQPLLHGEEDLQDGLIDAVFADVLTAGWLYELGPGEERGEQSSKDEDAHDEYRNTCQLLFKAIELHGARQAIQELDADALTPAPTRSQPASTGGSGAASGPLLVEALSRDNLSQRLFLVPYYGLRPINSATLDIRLGNWFRIARRTRSTSIDLTDHAQLQSVRREQQSEVYVSFGQHFTLHPGDFALAISLEYVAIPPDLVAFVEGKSSLGRAGLIVATATQVAPGFKGGIVLELFNSGTVPVKLKPGMQIAQLAFFKTDRSLPTEWLYGGKFRCQVKP